MTSLNFLFLLRTNLNKSNFSCVLGVVAVKTAAASFFCKGGGRNGNGLRTESELSVSSRNRTTRQPAEIGRSGHGHSPFFLARGDFFLEISPMEGIPPIKPFLDRLADLDAKMAESDFYNDQHCNGSQPAYNGNHAEGCKKAWNGLSAA